MGMPLLAANAQIVCPHSGTVSIVTKNARVSSDKQFLVTGTDKFLIVGCKNPPAVGPMCTEVQWLVPATRVFILGQPALLFTSSGLCLPVSAPPVVSPAPSRIQGI